MKNNADVDLLIIGQGLAGSAVAVRALSANYRIFVIDQPSNNFSSRVAAGLFNPVTGRKMSKTWMADELFPCLADFYRSVERLTGETFFHPMPIYRAFTSIEEQNEWMGRSADEEYRTFVESVETRSGFGDEVNDPYGGILLKGSGYLNTGKYLDAVRSLLKARGCYEESLFEAGRLEPGKDGAVYGSIRARKVIFCQGIGSLNNPWFADLPIRPLKGEFLTVQCQWNNSVILNRGVYVVPASKQGEWRVGATFNRNDKVPGVTTEARSELTRKLEELVRIPFAVSGQQWGFRPTTPDRRPMIGSHPKHENLIIFNGLGTKGVSLAPYFSEVLIRWMESRGTIDKVADVSRFY